MPRRARNVSHQRASGPGRNRHRDLGCRCRQASWHQPRQRTWPDRRAPRRQRVSRPVDRGQRRQRLDDQFVRRQLICRAHRATMRSQRPGGRAAPALPGVLGPVRPSHEMRANAQREKEPQEVREDEGGQIGGQHGEAPRCEGASRPDDERACRSIRPRLDKEVLEAIDGLSLGRWRRPARDTQLGKMLLKRLGEDATTAPSS